MSGINIAEFSPCKAGQALSLDVLSFSEALRQTNAIYIYIYIHIRTIDTNKYKYQNK